MTMLNVQVRRLDRSAPRSRESRQRRGEPNGKSEAMNGSNQPAEETKGIIRQPRPLMRSSREVLTVMGLYPR